MRDALRRWFRDRFWFIVPSRGLTAPADALTPKVLVINYDPTVQSEGGRRLHEVCRWTDPRILTEGYVADLAECSKGYVQYELVEWLDVDTYPIKKDGFRYTDESYLRCWRGQGEWHDPDRVDYHAIFETFGIPNRVERGEIDEVWLWAFPYSGFWESTMAGRGAYFCNSQPVAGIDTSRVFVTMGFNYERGVGEMLEDFVHRVEFIMWHVYGSWQHRETHAWNRFTLYDKVAPGEAACGTAHYAPNSVRDYDWGNERYVLSTCDAWLSYPDLTGEPHRVNCQEWGDGDTRAHHRWWLDHLPCTPGRTRGKLNNWWAYAVDLNRFPESRA